jgi:hypothetical protein
MLWLHISVSLVWGPILTICTVRIPSHYKEINSESVKFLLKLHHTKTTNVDHVKVYNICLKKDILYAAYLTTYLLFCYGCETWSLKLFETRVGDIWKQGVGEDTGLRREEMTEAWRKLHIKENQINRACMGEIRNAYILVGKSKGKRPIRSHNIKMDLQNTVGGFGTDSFGPRHGECWAPVYTIITTRFHKRRRISWLFERLLTPQDGLCYMEIAQ